MIFQFSDITVDAARYELTRDGSQVPIEPRVFDLLVYLISRPQQVMNQDELVSAVWSGRVVSDATVASAIKNARKALGDNGHQQRYIQTVHSRGFRFVGTPSRHPPESAGTTLESSPPTSGRSPITTPTLLVRPFDKLFDHSALTHYVDGLVAAIHTTLTRIPLLRIRAWRPDGGRDPQGEPVAEAATEDFVLQGSVQVYGRSVRANIQLVDGHTGDTLWGELFEETLDNRSLPTEELLQPIIGKLEPQLTKAIFDRVTGSDYESTAESLYLEASSTLCLRGWYPQTFDNVAGLLRKSIAMNPDFALAYALLSLTLSLGYSLGLLPNDPKIRREVETSTEKGLVLNNNDSAVLGFIGCALADLNDLNRAKPILEKAIAISSINAQAWAALGAVYLKEINLSKAIQCLTRSIDLSPLDSRLSIWGALLALALALDKQIDAAVNQARIACARDELNYFPRVVQAVVHLLGKDTQAASESLSEAYRIRPDLSPRELDCMIGSALAKALLQLPAPGSP